MNIGSRLRYEECNMGAVAGPAAAIGLVASTASSVVQSQGVKAADDMQADELARKAAIGQTAATETNANLTMRLNQSLGNIDAVRAAEHADPASPVTAALRSTTTAIANEDRVIKVGNILSQSEEDTAASDYMRKSGSYALTQGWLSGLAGAATTLGKTNPSALG
jgi:hypothetical protein